MAVTARCGHRKGRAGRTGLALPQQHQHKAGDTHCQQQLPAHTMGLSKCFPPAPRCDSMPCLFSCYHHGLLACVLVLMSLPDTCACAYGRLCACARRSPLVLGVRQSMWADQARGLPHGLGSVVHGGQGTLDGSGAAGGARHMGSLRCVSYASVSTVVRQHTVPGRLGTHVRCTCVRCHCSCLCN